MQITILVVAALNESYPELEWFRVYTDCFKVGMRGHAGAGVRQEFAHYIPLGTEGTAFKAEVKAIEVTLLNLIPRIRNFN